MRKLNDNDPRLEAQRAAARLVLAGGLAIAGASGTASADLIAYDGFDYTPVGSDLQFRAGGFGFGSDWAPGGFNASSHTNYDIAAGSLAFNNLLTSGNRVASPSIQSQSIGGLTRALSAPLGAPGSTRYLSFELRPEGTLNQGFLNGFFGVTLETAGEPELFVGKSGGAVMDRYVLEDRGGAQQVASPGPPIVVGETALLVVKAEFLQGNDRFTLYVNPTPGGPEPTAGGVVKFNSDLGTVTGLTIYSTGAFSLDELRLGDTFEDVTPAVPEPASLGLVALGGLALRRRISR